MNKKDWFIIFLISAVYIIFMILYGYAVFLGKQKA